MGMTTMEWLEERIKEIEALEERIEFERHAVYQHILLRISEGAEDAKELAARVISGIGV